MSNFDSGAGNLCIKYSHPNGDYQALLLPSENGDIEVFIEYRLSLPGAKTYKRKFHSFSDADAMLMMVGYYRDLERV